MGIVRNTIVSNVELPRVRSLGLYSFYCILMTSQMFLISSIPFFFANETNLFYSHKDQNYLVEAINSEIHKLNEWFKCNKLSLNAKKSSFMVFQPRQKSETLDLSTSLTSTRINRVREVVSLGVVLDEHVTWKPHISHIANKVSKATGILYKSSPHYVPCTTH